MCPRRISALRQSPEHVGQSSRFCKGLRLGADHQNPHSCYDRMVTDPAARPPRPPRSESREALELQAIRAQHPELAGAVDMHLELLELQRRIQGRVPLPMLDLSADDSSASSGAGAPAPPLRRHPARSDGPSADGASDRRRAATLRRPRTGGLREGAGPGPRHEAAGRSSDAGSREPPSVSSPWRAWPRRCQPEPT